MKPTTWLQILPLGLCTITRQMQVERHNNQHGVWFQTCAILILLVMRFT